MAYAETEELFRILKIRDPSTEQTAAGERVLEAAAREIDHEISLAADDNLEPDELELATAVNLERAVEHWRQQEVSWGLVTIDAGVTERIARDTWERHAFKLAPLKRQWGIA